MERYGPKPSAELFLLSARGNRRASYTKSRREENALNEAKPPELTFDRGWNLPELGEVNIEMGEKDVLHGLLGRAGGKDLRGEIGKIVFTFAKPSFRDTTRRFWLKRRILLPWQSRRWRRRAAAPCGCSRRWRRIWRGLFSAPPVYSVAAADRRTSHQRARLQLSHWVQALKTGSTAASPSWHEREGLFAVAPSRVKMMFKCKWVLCMKRFHRTETVTHLLYSPGRHHMGAAVPERACYTCTVASCAVQAAWHQRCAVFWNGVLE